MQGYLCTMGMVWRPERERSSQEDGEGVGEIAAVCNGMEIKEVRENEMEIYRCTTRENLAEMRLSSNLLGE